MHISSRTLLPLAAAAAVVAAGCGSDDDSASTHHFAPPTVVKSTATGAALVPVPRFVGREYEAVRRIARRSGFSFKVNGWPGTPISESTCMAIESQAPAAGTRRPRGSDVGVVIGSCPHEIRRKAREVANG